MSKKIIKQYDVSQDQHGDSAQGFMWGSSKTAAIYYQVTLMIATWSGQSCLEVGCGSGTMFDYIQEKSYPIVYSGVDINLQAIELAQHKYQDTSFKCYDILDSRFNDRHDYLLAAGAFNILSDDIQDHQGYLKMVIKKMFSLCHKGVSISFKTMVSQEDRLKGFVAYNPVDIFDFSLSLSKFATLNHAFSKYFAVLHLYKE